MRDPIGRWYDAGFDRLNVIVPQQTWEAINKATRDWQATWLKESQDAITADPKASNWDNLSQSLAAYNNAQKMRTRFIYRSLVLASAFILIPWLISDYTSINRQDNIQFTPLAQAQVQVEEANNITDVQIEGADFNATPNITAENQQILDLEKNNTSSVTLEEGQTPILAVTEIENSASVVNTQNPDEIVSELTPRSIQQIDNNLQFSQIIESSILTARSHSLTPNFDNEPDDIASLEVGQLPVRTVTSISIPLNKTIGKGIEGKKLRTIPSPTWMLGIQGNLHANTLLNPMTQMEQSNVAGIDNRLSYNLSGGLSARRYIGSRSSFETNLMFGETRRQITNDTRTGTLIKKDIHLKYNSLSLAYRRAISPRWKMSEVAINAGFYGALRSSIEEKWNNQTKDFLVDGFGNVDVGFTAGIDYTVVLNRRLRLASGLKYQIGAVNIFKGLDYMPSDFYQTYTSSFGFTTGLYYCF